MQERSMIAMGWGGGDAYGMRKAPPQLYRRIPCKRSSSLQSSSASRPPSPPAQAAPPKAKTSCSSRIPSRPIRSRRSTDPTVPGGPACIARRSVPALASNRAVAPSLERAPEGLMHRKPGLHALILRRCREVFGRFRASPGGCDIFRAGAFHACAFVRDRRVDGFAPVIDLFPVSKAFARTCRGPFLQACAARAVIFGIGGVSC